MNIAIIGNENLTMTSLEVSEMLGSQHNNVRLSIERLAAKGVIQLPAVQLVENIQSLSPNNKTKTYIFSGEKGKRDSIIVVAQLSPEFTARLVDRWQELESQATQPFNIPQTLPEALRLAADLSEQKAAVEAQLAIASPKADALDRIATVSDGSLCLRDAAKELQMQPKQFNLWMQANKWIYKRAGGSNFIGYQDRIQAGLLEHKASIVIDGAGNERLRDQVRVTAKGLARLAGLLQQEAA